MFFFLFWLICFNFGAFPNFWGSPAIQDGGSKMAAIWNYDIITTLDDVITIIVDFKGNIIVRSIYTRSAIVITSLVANYWRGGEGRGGEGRGGR